jgi:hypothetical protein
VRGASSDPAELELWDRLVKFTGRELTDLLWANILNGLPELFGGKEPRQLTSICAPGPRRLLVGASYEEISGK